MTKSQNTKNEQQKDLCITSEQLTEQWKKEHSIKENQHYYIKDTRDNIYIDYFWGDGWLDNSNEDIAEVLAPVPSYTELQSMNEAVNQAMAANIKLVEQNAQLKELLKECRPYFEALVEKRLKLEYIPQVYELLTKIDEALK